MQIDKFRHNWYYEIDTRKWWKCIACVKGGEANGKYFYFFDANAFRRISLFVLFRAQSHHGCLLSLQNVIAYLRINDYCVKEMI